MIITIEILISVLLLIISAFFSLSETSLVSLSAQKVKRLALRHPPLAQAFIRWLKHPQELLTAILVGNTLVNILFASLVTMWAVQTFSGIQPSQLKFIAWILETGCLVILGEMAPKLIARSSPEKTSLIVLPLLSVLCKLTTPFLAFVTWVMKLIYPKWTDPSPASEITFSVKELKGLLEEGQHVTEVSPDSYGMMKRVLELNDRTAERIMTQISNVDILELDPPGKRERDRDLLLDLVIENGHTRTPVKHKGQFVGIIHSSDLLPLVLKDEGRDLISMVRKALDIPGSRPVSALLQEFKLSGIHAGFVRNAAKDIIGFITLEDVLEEITGEILDEYDVAHGTP